MAAPVPQITGNCGGYADYSTEVRADSCALSQVNEENVELTQFILHECIVEQIADVPGTQNQDQFLTNLWKS